MRSMTEDSVFVHFNANILRFFVIFIKKGNQLYDQQHSQQRRNHCNHQYGFCTERWHKILLS